MAEGKDGQLNDIYMRFCTFGNKANRGMMEGKTFAKLCKDCKLLSKTCTMTDVDLTFAKVKPKGQRVCDYKQFKQALEDLSVKRYPKTFRESGKEACYDKIVQAIIAGEGPTSTGTRADNVRFHDDKTTYTGVYKQGGPTNVDNTITLSSLADRTPSDARGRKMGAGDRKR